MHLKLHFFHTYKSYSTHLSQKHKQRGSSLVIAVFIMVVMSLLGAALIKMMQTNEEAFVYEVLGTRAYNAAQSGIQWRLQKIFPLRNAGSNADMCIDDEFDELKTIDGFIDCTAIVECAVLVHNTTTFYTVTSTGQCNVNGEQTSRMIQVQAKSIN